MPPSFPFTSPAFAPGGAIPARYSCQGADVSPPLAWNGEPAGTVAFALVVHDRDARGFVHWVATGLPGDTRALPEGASGRGAPSLIEGRNDFGRIGWGGPCPPPGSGDHHYVFTLYALSAPLQVSGSPSAVQVRSAAAGRTLATAILEGTYRR